MDSGTNNLLEMLSEHVLELADAGKWEEAMSSADAVIEKARAANTGEFDDLVSLAKTLEMKGDILRQQSYLEEARMVYLEALEILGGRKECTEMLARISASIGVL